MFANSGEVFVFQVNDGDKANLQRGKDEFITAYDVKLSWLRRYRLLLLLW